MRKSMYRQGKAAAAAVLAAVMLIPAAAYGAEPIVRVASDSGVQMSSEPEAVYINNYAGTARSENFNDNWKFFLGDASGAEQPAFDDSEWRRVNLPHDYSIEQPFSDSMEAESGYLPGGTGWYRKNFTLDESAEGKEVRIDFGGVYMDATVWVNGQELGTHPYGYTPFSFDITDYVEIDQENVITVKVNHQTPSSRWYSGSGIYRSVDLTITDPVHVDLFGTKIETPDLKSETAQGGGETTVTTDIRTTVVNDSGTAAEVTLTHSIFPKGGTVDDAIGTSDTPAQSIDPGDTADIQASVEVSKADLTLWSTDTPVLYTVRTEVKVGGETVDTYDTEYGFRYFEFHPDDGFSLNGREMKLKGVCMHHDQGSLGAEAWEAAIRRQVRILKDMGCNSIRVTHNPSSDELIEICNEEGILVVEEIFDGWMYPKNGNGQDYARFFNTEIGQGNGLLGARADMTWAEFDLTAAVKRGQNAPSIIMWSLGNEISEGTSAPTLNDAYRSKQKELVNWTTAIDDTRPVTRGDNRIKGDTAGMAATMFSDLTDAGGTAGMNYSSGDQYDAQHKAHPDWKIYGAETASSINSRGVYDRLGNGGSEQPSDKKLTSYDNQRVNWGALASSAWYDVIIRDFVAGEYVWTGFDYIGEPTPWNGTDTGAKGTWPSPKNSYFGIIDTAGFPKDSYYFYQSQWNDDIRTLHILPAWNGDVVYQDGSGNVKVDVYTDADKVELFFTPEGGQEITLGAKELTTEQTPGGYTYKIYKGSDAKQEDHKNLYLTWNVAYKDGTLRAVAYDRQSDGSYQEIAETQGRSVVTTAGSEAKLAASVDRDEIRADGADLAYITVDITDEAGNIVPDGADNVKFTVEGEGRLVGVDNGKQDDHQSYQDDNRNAFGGKVMAVVQSTKQAGKITVTAEAAGRESAVVEINTTATPGSSGGRKVAYYELSRNYYVKTGNMPALPEKVKAAYSDGTFEDVSVDWPVIDEAQTAVTGTFFVTGTTSEGDRLSVTVNMIDQIAALLNYSTTVSAGTTPNLPASRQAVLQNGKVIDVSFPVAWGQPDGGYDTPGTVTVKGTANVLGQVMEVTATVRVQEETITLGANVAGAAHLSQNIDQQFQGDTLEAVKDGATAMNANTSGGPNLSAWSNWKDTNTNPDTTRDAEITFWYDTQQKIKQLVVYFAKDGNGLSYPAADTTRIYISETGEPGSWKEAAAVETIADNEASANVKAYTYDLDPTTATYVKLYVKNNPDGRAVAITEVQMNSWQGSTTINSGAEFTAMKVNGLDVASADLAAWAFDTEAILVDSLEYTASENASVTELPVYNDKKALIIESEDHTQRNMFTINLRAQVASGSSEPTDESMDYDRTKTVAEAGSEYTTGGSSTDGPADWATDGDTGTWWHTDYSGGNTADISQRWITLMLQEGRQIDGYRYYARGGQSNGRVKEYRIETSMDGLDWQEAATGSWEDSEGWKLARFGPVEAKYVRLTGVSTYGAGGQADQFMTAAEVRVRLAPDLTDISGADVIVTDQTTNIVDQNHPVELTADDITVTLDDGTKLRYGVDYIVTYRDNTGEGTATAVVTGLGQYGYTGTVEQTFVITKSEEPAVMESITVTTPCKVSYTEGEFFDPAGLVLTATYSDGSSQLIEYAGYAGVIQIF